MKRSVLIVFSFQGSSRKWCQRHGIEEQRLYELVKLKEQFHSILKNGMGIEGVEVKKRDREFDTENDYWTDPLYKKRRQQRFLLSHQKYAQSSGRRKVLKFQRKELHDDDNDNGKFIFFNK